MKNLTILVFCAIFSTGYLQEWAGYNSFPSFDNSERTGLPIQVRYAEPPVQRKPCPNRRNVQGEEQWIPSFRSIITKPLINNYYLKPQSLKYESLDTDNEPNISDSLNIPGDKTTSSDKIPAELYPINESKTAPDTNPNTVNENRRSNFYDMLGNFNELPNNEEYDCDPDVDDYFGIQNQNGNYLVTSKPTTVGIEQKVIEMLRDCILKKRKYIEGRINQLDEVPLAGSRRSMGSSDIDDENDSSTDDSDNRKESTPDASANKNDAVETTDESISETDKENVTPAFTLRPGKLFNELKNPAKGTGIANIPASRKMQEGSRVCYACSTATNPSCWTPDSKTTIKYCHENQHCVKKSIGVKSSLTILRDCAESCDASSIVGLTPKYNSCSVCHKDLCNSAIINRYNLLIIFLISAFKCTL